MGHFLKYGTLSGTWDSSYFMGHLLKYGTLPPLGLFLNHGILPEMKGSCAVVTSDTTPTGFILRHDF